MKTGQLRKILLSIVAENQNVPTTLAAVAYVLGVPTQQVYRSAFLNTLTPELADLIYKKTKDKELRKKLNRWVYRKPEIYPQSELAQLLQKMGRTKKEQNRKKTLTEIQWLLECCKATLDSTLTRDYLTQVQAYKVRALVDASIPDEQIWKFTHQHRNIKKSGLYQVLLKKLGPMKEARYGSKKTALRAMLSMSDLQMNTVLARDQIPLRAAQKLVRKSRGRLTLKDLEPWTVEDCAYPKGLFRHALHRKLWDMATRNKNLDTHVHVKPPNMIIIRALGLTTMRFERLLTSKTMSRETFEMIRRYNKCNLTKSELASLKRMVVN